MANPPATLFWRPRPATAVSPYQQRRAGPSTEVRSWRSTKPKTEVGEHDVRKISVPEGNPAIARIEVPGAASKHARFVARVVEGVAPLAYCARGVLHSVNRRIHGKAAHRFRLGA